MKKLNLCLGVLVTSVLFTFSACEQENFTDEPTTVATEFQAPAYELADLNGLEVPEVSAASETEDFKVNTATCKDDRHKLGRILKELQLDENQRKAVKRFVEQHQTCVAEHHDKIKELHQTLLRRANAAREELVQAYKAGRITKAQLEERLKALHNRLKEEITKHADKQPHLRILQKCRHELIHHIESVLNREQLLKWNRWKASLLG